MHLATGWHLLCRKESPYGCVSTTLENMTLLWKILANTKIIFSDEAYFDLGGHVNKQNGRTENLYAYIEQWTQAKRVTVWCEFWSRDIIVPFFFENEQGKAVTVIRSCWTNFCSQKLKRRRIWAILGFNRTALCAIQPMLHSMFSALFLKIALSAAEMMSFSHVGAAIWHRWTIICGVPSKYYVDKPETIDNLTDNIREAICGIHNR